MGFLSDAYANTMLDTAFAGTVYIALSTTTPTNTGTNVTEPSGNNYSRVAILTSYWAAAASRSKSNSAAVVFPEASGSWGTVTHFALYSAATGGTFLGWSALTNSRSVTAGLSPVFAVGALVVTIPGT